MTRDERQSIVDTMVNEGFDPDSFVDMSDADVLRFMTEYMAGLKETASATTPHESGPDEQEWREFICANAESRDVTHNDFELRRVRNSDGEFENQAVPLTRELRPDDIMGLRHDPVANTITFVTTRGIKHHWEL